MTPTPVTTHYAAHPFEERMMEVDLISLFEPECGTREIALVRAVLESAKWGDGPMIEGFECGFAGWVGRKHAVAVGSGLGDEVICTAHTWRQVAQAITLCGAKPVFADINYWTSSLNPEKAALKITPKTRALLAGNTNGHPAALDDRLDARKQGVDEVHWMLYVMHLGKRFSGSARALATNVGAGAAIYL